jgi:tetratricopeptide (TPR) repeat protein
MIPFSEVQMDPQSAAHAQKEFDQAGRELERGNLLAALSCLERALAIWDDPHWYSRLGYCIARERGHLTRAYELCRSAIEHEPRNPLHYLYLGKVHQIAANQCEALRAMRQGMSLGGTPELQQELERMGTRKAPVIPVLSRKNPLNKILGRVFARLGLR